jgi:glycosyltransferase involved in cell wall biosynthesis
MLFYYIKESKVKVVWTLHDCWSFTGHCPYFTIAKCDKWKTGCHHCPQPEIYPKMYLDTSKQMYNLKKSWFTGIEDMTIATPSKWLGDLVKESFLKDYPIKVINNGIDLSVFTPRESNFRSRYGLENKKILLGVSFDWGYRKGLDVFIELSKRLDPEKYQIVLVGTNKMVDEQLPGNILSIHGTENQIQLAEIYTAADLFVNPTREEVLGLVNIESLACTTPVLTFRTGGSPECIDSTCGSVVEVDDVDALEKEILRICQDNPYSKEACLERAKNFDMYDRFKEYIKLYENTSHSIDGTIHG